MQQILPISQLTMFLKGIIEDDEDLQNLWVDGEISNLTIARSGHAYFSLKDDQSQFRAVMWRNALQRQRVVPREGDRIIAHGNVTFYQPRGELQLQVDLIQPQGTGLLQLQLEELRQRLETEGIFDESRKRPLPAFPMTIGVVTSATGAVWHDIQHVTARRNPLAHLILSPATVQGETAPASIVAALERLIQTAEPDVIIIGRGGGSLEDLWAFNDERVVRAIFASPVPIVSAVGHETDTTLADYVADRRAPTPSAAAELTSPDVKMLNDVLLDTRKRMTSVLFEQLDDRLQRIDDLQERLQRTSPATRLARIRAELDALSHRAHLGTRYSTMNARHEVGALTELLAALNPSALFERGYAFVENASTASPLRSAGDVMDGDPIRVHLRDGIISADVTAISHHPGKDT